MVIDVYEYSNQGGRSYNEDSVGSLIKGDSGIFVVADGLGGHAFGELASSCVRDTLISGFTPGVADPAGWYGSMAALANRNILQLQLEKGDIMKSTFVSLLIDGPRAVWAHSGDSRLYFFHKGYVAAYTEDHSVSYKKYKAGEIDREAIAGDEDQSSLLRTLGNQERFEPDIFVLPKALEAGDAFFLCTDGAWEFLRDEEMAVDLAKAEDAKHWAYLMLMRMMDRIKGGNDNLTLQTIMIK